MNDGPWGGLEGGDARRVDSHGKYDFFWARIMDGSHALVLRLPAGTPEVRPLPKLKHVGTFYRTIDGRNAYCLSLDDRSHLDLFETLCRDVVAAAEMADDAQAALARAVRRTMRWHHLLRGGKKGMSLEEQRGLVAELAFLRELTSHLPPLAAVEAWKGPDESAKDFEMPGLYIEIKARRSASHPKVRISSEAQLADITDARLYIRIQDVDTSYEPEGDNLASHVERTGMIFDDDLSALDIWEQRIAATGFSPESVEEDRRWHLGTVRTYEVRPGFPRIVPPLPAGVDEVAYSIRLDACADFEVPGSLQSLLNLEHPDV